MMRFTALLALIALAVMVALLAMPQAARANSGRTEEVRLMMVPATNGGSTVGPILNLKFQQPLSLPLLGGVTMHAGWRHAMDRGTWSENRVIVGVTKPLFAGLDVTADYERKYNTDVSRVWVSVGMPFQF